MLLTKQQLDLSKDELRIMYKLYFDQHLASTDFYEKKRISSKIAKIKKQIDKIK